MQAVGQRQQHAETRRGMITSKRKIKLASQKPEEKKKGGIRHITGNRSTTGTKGK